MSFPFHDSDLENGPLAFRDSLPEAVDLAVIGGGVIGVSTALYAVRKGLSVVVLDKGRVAAEQSSRNWGWVRVQGRDMAEIPIALESQELWKALDQECQGRLGLRETGVTYLARSQADLDRYDGWLQQARPLGVASQIWSRDEITKHLPQANAPWIGALHTPTDMKAEPWVAVPELAHLARASGALVREHCAVRGLDLEAGQISGVITEEGRVRCSKVVLAGGAWSSLFLRRHGVSLPQLSVKSMVAATNPVEQVSETSGVDSVIAFGPRVDGGYTLAPSTHSEFHIGPDAFRHLRHYLPPLLSGEFKIQMRGRAPAPKHWPDAFGTKRKWRDDEISPFERLRILDPKPDPKMVQAMLADFEALFPAAQGAGVLDAWCGMIDVLPDVAPVVDHVEKLPGLIAVTGMCGHGFGIGPAFGRITADLVTGDDPKHDLTRFRLSRFTDGSKLIPGPNV